MKKPTKMRVLRGLLLSAAIVLLLAEIAGETGLLGPWVLQSAARTLRDHGLVASASRARVGVFHGLRLENLSLRDAGDPNILLAEARVVRLHPKPLALLRASLRLRAVDLEGVDGYVPALPQPSAQRENNTPKNNSVAAHPTLQQPLLHNADARIEFLPERVQLTVANADLHGLPANLDVTLRYPHGASPAGGRAACLCVARRQASSALSPGDKSSPPSGQPQPANWSWAHRPASLPDTARALVRRLLAFCRQNTFPEQESGLELSLVLPLDAPEQMRGEASFSALDVTVAGLGVRKIKARIALDSEAVHVRSFTVFPAADTAITGTLRYERATGKLAMQTKGRVRPDRLRQVTLLSGWPPVADFACDTPVQFELTLNPAPPKLETLDAAFTLSGSDATIRNLPIARFRCEGTLKDNQLALSAAEVGTETGATVSANGTIALDTRRWQLEAGFAGNLAALLGELGQPDPLPPLLTLRSGPEKDRADITLAGVGAQRDALDGNGTVRLRTLQIGKQPFAKADADLTIDAQVLTLANLILRPHLVANSANERIEGNARVDLAAGTLEGSVQARLTPARAKKSLSLAKGDGPPTQTTKPAEDQALKAWLRATHRQAERPPGGTVLNQLGGTGTMRVDLTLEPSPWTQPEAWTLTGTLAGEDLAVATVPVDTMTADLAITPEHIAVANAHLRTSQTSVFRGRGQWSRGQAGGFSAHVEGNTDFAQLKPYLPGPNASTKLADLTLQDIQFRADVESTDETPGGWTAEARFSTGAGRLENLEVSAIRDARVTITPPLPTGAPLRMQFVLPEVDLAGNGRFRGVDVGVEIGEALLVTVSGTAHAPPELVRAFIVAPRYQRRYARIWNDFRWSEDTPPHITLRSLRYFKNPEENKWWLCMDADIEATDCEYRGVDAKTLTGTVLLDLPMEVQLKDVQIDTQGGEHAEGRVLFELDNTPSVVSLEVNGTFDPWTALGAAVPAWADDKAATFAPDSQVDFSGKIPIERPGDLSLAGSLATDSLVFGKLPLDAVDTDWVWQDGCLELEKLSAGLVGGRLSASGRYCFSADEGRVKLSADGASLQDLLANFSGTEKLRDQGKVAVPTCEVTLHRHGKGEALMLKGEGRLEVSESQLWSIPVFGSLASAVNLAPLRQIIGLGDISAFGTDLVFDGETVQLHEFETNGTVVSLEGIKPGSYNWKTGELSLVVRGKVLRRTLIVPFITKPISWLFEAELKGTQTQPEWRLLSAVKKGLFGGEKTE